MCVVLCIGGRTFFNVHNLVRVCVLKACVCVCTCIVLQACVCVTCVHVCVLVGVCYRRACVLQARVCACRRDVGKASSSFPLCPSLSDQKSVCLTLSEGRTPH